MKQIITTLHVIRNNVPSKILADSHEDAIELAVKGEQAGEFIAVSITDWSSGEIDGVALREEIERRRLV
jgi:hypothetical protein